MIAQHRLRIVAARGRSVAAGLAQLVTVLALATTLAGCSDRAFVVSPSLDPRVSRILAVYPSGLLRGRTCYVYLPAGYPEPGRRYPVLYVQDGESAFDAGPGSPESFGFDRTADALTSAGAIEPMIIVAIPSGGSRDRDYVPVFEFIEPDSTDNFRVIADSTRGDRYVRAIRDELKPIVDRTFASDPSPASTGIAGFSLGGLISVYAAYTYPGTFGTAGGFSGTYLGASPYFLPFVELTGRPPGGSLFIDVGLIDDNTSAARRLNSIALEQGFQPGADYEYRALAEETHSIPSVRRRIPAFLQFFSRRAALPAAIAQLIPR